MSQTACDTCARAGFLYLRGARKCVGKDNRHAILGDAETAMLMLNARCRVNMPQLWWHYAEARDVIFADIACNIDIACKNSNPSRSMISIRLSKRTEPNRLLPRVRAHGSFIAASGQRHKGGYRTHSECWQPFPPQYHVCRTGIRNEEGVHACACLYERIINSSFY